MIPQRVRHQLRPVVLLAIVGALALLAGACGDDTDSATSTTTAGAGYKTLKVPADFPTIQKAVNAAKAGDLVLISPGVYHEQVRVETDDIVIRGLDRNRVIIDGEFKRENGIQVFSDGVAVENLTARNHTSNGVFFTGDYGQGVTLKGYRASYVTAYNNGLYGLYAFNATNGQFDHSYGSGHPDSAFYVGQCNPCNALITDVVGETNMLGYSGTNSTGVTIINSVFNKNRSGIDPNSLFSEKLHPNSGSTIIGNIVTDNNNPLAPNNDGFAEAFGSGIVLGGTSNVVVERNLIRGNVNAGVVVTDLPNSTNPDTKKPESFKPEGNMVRDNVLSGNTTDLAYLTVGYASRPFGNCFSGNTFDTTFPEKLETKMPCDENREKNDLDLGDLSGILTRLTSAPPDVDYKTIAAPPEQVQMPDAATASPVPAKNVPAKVDLAKIAAPKG